MPRTETAGVRAARGAELLDEKMPGWWRKIRTTSLDMEHGIILSDEPPDTPACVLCQLADLDEEGDRGYYTAASKLGLRSWNQQRIHGFVGSGSDEYDALTVAWTAEVRKRRQAAKASR